MGGGQTGEEEDCPLRQEAGGDRDSREVSHQEVTGLKAGAGFLPPWVPPQLVSAPWRFSKAHTYSEQTLLATHTLVQEVAQRHSGNTDTSTVIDTKTHSETVRERSLKHFTHSSILTKGHIPT